MEVCLRFEDDHLSHTGILPRISSRSIRLPRIRVKDALRKITVPASVKRIAEMPLTMIGLGCISAAILTLTVAGGLAFIGIALIAVEYMIAN